MTWFFLFFILRISNISGQNVSKSKLSLFTGLGDLSWQFIQDTKPKVLKIFDSFSNNENAEKVKQMSPNTLIIGRIYNSNQPTNIPPQQAAQDWWNENKQIILSNPTIKYWEGYNEPTVNTYQQLQWITQMEIARMNILTQNNLNAVIVSLNENVFHLQKTHSDSSNNALCFLLNKPL